MSKNWNLVLVGVLFSWGVLLALDKTDGEKPREPEALSIFPLGGQVGTTLDVTLRGQHLDEAYAVWFQCEDLEVRLKDVQKIHGQTTEESFKRDIQAKQIESAEHRALLQIRIGEKSKVGLHSLRIITPRGMSNALSFQVSIEPVVTEADLDKAQDVQVPVIINGRTIKNGDIDLYAFEANEGQRFYFQSFSVFPIYIPYSAESELNLFAPTGSWFDPNRLLRLPWETNALSFVPVHPNRRQSWGGRLSLFPMPTHRFKKDGRYLVSMGSFLGEGSPDFIYQLRIANEAPNSSTLLGQPAHPDPADWLERDSGNYAQHGAFPRPLKLTRLQELRARSIKPPSVPVKKQRNGAGKGSSQDSLVSLKVSRYQEQEPNENQAPKVSTKVILEGAIDPPGDIDSFLFDVESGEELAFEIETPATRPPNFNPWLQIADSNGQDVFDNIHMEYGGDGDDVAKTTERKTVFTFETGGTYKLRIRDLTSRRGGPDHAYRVLIRPKIPHLGRVEFTLGVKGRRLAPTTDRVNLEPGKSKTFTVVCDLEEGFEGEVAMSATNMPKGVSILPTTPTSYTSSLLKGAYYLPMGKESGYIGDQTRYRPVRRAVALTFIASSDAPITKIPQLVQLLAQPVSGGRTGSLIPAGKIPIMILAVGQQASSSLGKKEYSQ